MLENAFREFSRASNSLANYYHALEDQIRELRREVEVKNRELEGAREDLTRILDSLPVGIIVLEQGEATFLNRKAQALGAEKRLDVFTETHVQNGELKTGIRHLRWKREFLEDGSGTRQILVLEDVTEMEKMKERRERDERLCAMGEMAARLAHEIRNPLGSMELFVSLMKEEGLKGKQKEYADYVYLGIRTIERVISNILSYTRPRTLAATKTRLAEVVREVVNFMAISIHSRGLKVDLAASYDGISSFDPDLIKLVLMNVVSNAIDACEGGGTITIDVRESGDYVVVLVEDTGSGMCDELKKNIFNPFFTTKDKGVGLGLFIVHNIVKAHGGFIEVESQEEIGTRFLIYLPKERI